ncbi:MAG: ABC transporter ATP-binding protein [Propionibacteriaceae bacterium]|nr:ABC transporter ATP-binding protein [Propionibacteriaceae bacterium]
MSAALPPDEGDLPALFTGRRRWLLTVLAGMGLAQAVLSVFTAFLTPRLLTGQDHPAVLSVMLIGAGLLVGAIRVGERVVSEDLGQDYVREVRKLLIVSALVPQRSVSLGSTIARTTNDLTAVKNWVALGISPLVVGVPLISGIVIAMFLLTPQLALVVALTLTAFAAGMVALSRPLLERARGLRRVRGRMAGHIADTVTAGEAIRVSGGVDREVERVDRLSERVAAAAHARAVVSGAMRGSAASVTAVLAVLVAVVGARVGSTGADITTAVFIAGMLAAPVTDLGRVGEYRQNLKAAHRVLAPVLANARAFHRHERRLLRQQAHRQHHGDPAGLARSAVHVADLVDREGTLPELIAAPGSRVLLTGDSAKRIRRVLSELTADRFEPDAWVVVAGRHLTTLPARSRRQLVGYASRNTPLERASIGRVIRYRTQADSDELADLVSRVGLHDRVAQLPDGVGTTLRRGGEPLTVTERAQLKLARALAGNPPLLVLDHLDDQLDQHGRSLLREILADYPGCVLVCSSNPEVILDCYDVWNVDELAPTLVIALPAREVPVRGPRRTTHQVGSATNPFGPPVFRSAAERAALRTQADPHGPNDDEDDE